VELLRKVIGIKQGEKELKIGMRVKTTKDFAKKVGLRNSCKGVLLELKKREGFNDLATIRITDCKFNGMNSRIGENASMDAGWLEKVTE
jgi:hypothetical protein